MTVFAIALVSYVLFVIVLAVVEEIRNMRRK